ncbi:hypothetical protein AB0B25_16185 [Nocardia sp. NPDC049190]|uniref:hypothetical protein n=1 Tax=Nocardia sp. NPDC049190 TaxID=3155650 RepID=UPI0033F9BA58
MQIGFHGLDRNQESERNALRKFIHRALLALATAAALSVVVSPTAQAVATPAEACGNNYHEIDHHDLGKVARIHLLYNGSTNCVVTAKFSSYAGKSTRMLASIAKQNSDGNFTQYIHDDGNYEYYAGPVKVNAAGVCIDWGGGVPVAGEGFSVWMSGRSHCG